MTVEHTVTEVRCPPTASHVPHVFCVQQSGVWLLQIPPHIRGEIAHTHNSDRSQIYKHILCNIHAVVYKNLGLFPHVFILGNGCFDGNMEIQHIKKKLSQCNSNELEIQNLVSLPLFFNLAWILLSFSGQSMTDSVLLHVVLFYLLSLYWQCVWDQIWRCCHWHACFTFGSIIYIPILHFTDHQLDGAAGKGTSWCRNYSEIWKDRWKEGY